jgi:hypothetical protein
VEAQRGAGSLELCRNDGPQCVGSKQIKCFGPPEQVHAEQNSGEAQVMITVKMADQHVIDTLKRDLEARELHLRTFPAVNQEVLVLDDYKLARRKPPIGWKCSARSQYRHGE